jgi:large repetitive protein
VLGLFFTSSLQAQEITTPSPLPGGTINNSYSTTLAATGCVISCVWSAPPGQLPQGLNLSSAGVISGTPSNAGTYNFTVKASGLLNEAQKTFALTIATALSISTASLPSATVNAAYSQTLARNGGTAPFTWSIASGSLPSGLTLAAGTGIISGTPSAAGTANFTVRVTDSAVSNGATTTKALQIAVAAPLVITTSSLPGGITGSAYSQSVSGTGGTSPFTWSLAAGTLPTGLALGSGGLISGTPSAVGQFNFTVRVIDNVGAVATQQLSITVALPLLLTTASLPGGTAGTPYSATAAATGGTGPYSWSVTVGALPAGLTMGSGTGIISGTPSVAATANFLVQVSDSGSPVQTRTQPLSITIAATPTITTNSLPGGTATNAYSTTVTNSGGTPGFTWSIPSGSLPAGLALNSNTGVISGMPTVAGTSSFTIRVTDSVGAVASKGLSITINEMPVITTMSLQGGTVAAAYSQTLANTGGTSPVSWAVVGGSLPPGLSLAAGTGVISGVPTTAGTSSFTVRVTDNVGAIASQALSITLASALSVTTASLPGSTVGIPAYSTTLARAGGTGPFSWSIPTGTLPAGLTLNPGTGEIAGTPSAAATATFTVRVTDSVGATASKAMSIVIAQALTITTTSLVGGTVGNAYSQPIVSAGGTAPFNWTITAGPLPTGTGLNPDTGVISGTPSADGTFAFTVRVADSVGASASQQLSIVIVIPPTITTTSLPAGTAASPYSMTLLRNGGTAPFTWAVAAGTLPPGITLISGTGVLGGTPTSAGTSNFTVRVTDAAGATTSQALTIVIAPALSITTSLVPGGTTGTPYSATLVRTGGNAPFTWAISVGSLPDGLTLSSATGVIGGTPTTVGTFNFTVRVTDAAGATSTRALSTVVATALSITTTALPSGTVGTAYTASFAATGGTTPYSWSVTVGLLPPGLTLNSSTGAITGTPTTAGTSNITVQVIDSGNPGRTATQSFSVTIIPAIAISTTSLQGGIAGVAYAQTLTAIGGTPPYVWSITAGSGALPTGLGLNPNSGLISGTPAVAGSFKFTVRVSDSIGSVAASKELSISVDSGSGTAPPLTISNSTTLTAGTTGVGYSQSLNATGGVLPYTWSVTTGALPSGLQLSSGGVLGGTPAAAGSFSFTVQAKDSSSTAQTASKSLSITIVPPLTITTSSLPDATAGSAYSLTLGATAGTPPYSWSLTTGSLPAGMSLNTSTGTISGTTVATGTFNIRITLTDSQMLTTSKVFTLVVSLPAIDPNMASSVSAAQQLAFSPTLRSSYPADISGQLTLSFTPNAAVVNVVNNDPLPQFSNGTRTVNFTIPANTTTVLISPPVLLLTGTVAGTIRLSADVQVSGGSANLPAGATDIAPGAPKITALDAVQTSAGITIRTTGYSSTRSITSVGFAFDVRSASGIQHVNLTRNVDADFTTWFKDPSSAAYGSAFIFVQSFGVQGDASVIDAVTVTLTNSQGNTVSDRTPLTHQ